VTAETPPGKRPHTQRGRLPGPVRIRAAAGLHRAGPGRPGNSGAQPPAAVIYFRAPVPIASGG
jgi:hypothetical protein